MQNFNGICPACSSGMEIREYECPSCASTVRGRFRQGGILGLSSEQAAFVKTFLCCRGNIREVERELGISYPTVRGRLDAVIRALGLEAADDGSAERRSDVLDRLESGEIDAQEAAKLLKGKK